MASEMSFNRCSCFGYGSREKLVDVIKSNNYKRALLVTDDNLIKLGITKKVTDLLDDNKIVYDVYSEVKSNPNVLNVRHGVKVLRKNHCDYIIALGGGSVMDCAKAISAVCNNAEYKEVVNLKGVIECKDVLPIIAIPTTAGTGSEVSPIMVINDDATEDRRVAIVNSVIPTYAVVDTELMSTMPISLSVATGLDAFTQAIESYISPNHSVMSDTLSLKAIEIIYGNLEKAINKNKEAMDNMAVAQYMAGLSVSSTGLGVARSISYQVGSFYGVSDGVACINVLPAVLEYYKKDNIDRYKDILKSFGIKVNNMDDEDVLTELQDIIKNMASRLDVNGVVSCKKDEITLLAEKTMEDVWVLNSSDVSVSDVEDIIKSSF